MSARQMVLQPPTPRPARPPARLQRALPGQVFLVTQNVDDLHERGGSPQVCHMHGELLSMLCLYCGRRHPSFEHVDANAHCPGCDRAGGLRPDVVWFGEIPLFMDTIETYLSACDLFIAIGTSGAVYPAAGFVQLAGRCGALTVEVNREASDVSSSFHHHYVGCATDQVGLLVDELLAGRVG